MRSLCLLAACLVAATAPTGAQQATQRQATQRQVDSLAAELRALRVRVDSLLAELRRARAGAPARGDTAAVVDEITALRAAAAAAAGPAGAGDTARDVPPGSGGRERNLSQLNPEISVTGDLRAYASEGAQHDNFDPREIEIGFQSPLDPFSHTKVFVALEGGEVDVEEMYAYWTGLPGRVRLDVGKVRQQLGELNRWHLHALPEGEYPLALTAYAGEEGLAATGISLYRAFAGLGTHEFWLQVSQGSNEVLFDDGSAPAVLGHLNNFWQLSPAVYAQVGVTAIRGTNPDAALRTTLGGVDLRLTWRPPARALYREWTVRGELLGLEKQRAGIGETRYGAYLSTTYRLSRRWLAGLRGDYVEAAEGPLTIERHVIPSLTWWQSEWVFLRAEWRYRRAAGATSHQLAVQAVWSIGPHKHETY
jgi:hypothetical protein